QSIKSANIETDGAAISALQSRHQKGGERFHRRSFIGRLAIDRLRDERLPVRRRWRFLKRLDIASSPTRHLLLERLIGVLDTLADSALEHGFRCHRESGRGKCSNGHRIGHDLSPQNRTYLVLITKLRRQGGERTRVNISTRHSSHG